VKFVGNQYFSDGEVGASFATGSQADREELSFQDWVKKSGETGARLEKSPLPDAGRCIERYMQSLGMASTHDAFISEVRKQSKTNWRPALTASLINDWFRKGFGAEKAGEQMYPSLRSTRTTHPQLPARVSNLALSLRLLPRSRRQFLKASAMGASGVTIGAAA